jgi:hypothetical protein
MTQESKVNDDPFIGKPVAFSTNSDVVKELKKECGKRWSGEAICYHLDNKFGHVVGVVMRKSRGIGSRRGTNGESTYDVAWEFSALGETLVPFGFLFEGHLLAKKLLRSHAKMKNNTGSSRMKCKFPKSKDALTIRERLCTISDDEVEMQVSVSIFNVIVLLLTRV